MARIDAQARENQSESLNDGAGELRYARSCWGSKHSFTGRSFRSDEPASNRRVLSGRGEMGTHMASFYFDGFEGRTPPPPIPYSMARELLWQFLATVNLVLGGWYLWWRWSHSLNPDALWFAIPLAVAETLAFIGLIFFTINLWLTRDHELRSPPRVIAECISNPDEAAERQISVDVFFPTYNEDPELVRLSVRDAGKITYPHPIDIRIHVLDDGRRAAMEKVAGEEGAGYITRPDNVGFKAGNLRNAMQQTSGDFMVICDADTRVFPTILEDTLGYFTDPEVAWVQTPQWFYDIPEGVPLTVKLERYLGRTGYFVGAAIERIAGPVQVGCDPFCSDPRMFYDIIQRRRNWANAAFCCGAGSIHRREAVMEAALKTYAASIDQMVARTVSDIADREIKEDLEEAMRHELAMEADVIPYKFHVSEDIYTSIALHSDPERRWRSILHPTVESKMLSPQDLLSWVIQRFKYAGGTLDIAFHDNPLFRRGLTFAQRIMYAATFYGYLGCLWNVVFLAAPVVYLFTGIAPVAAYSLDFFKHAIPFLLANQLAFMVGTWGVGTWGGQMFYLSFFPINFRALWTVIRGRKISFPVTPKVRQEGSFVRLVVPQIVVIVATVAALIYRGSWVLLGATHQLGGLLTNTFWGCMNILFMAGIVRAALWKPECGASDGEDQ